MEWQPLRLLAGPEDLQQGEGGPGRPPPPEEPSQRSPEHGERVPPPVAMVSSEHPKVQDP
jgi:hypothetical protein